MKTIKSFVKDAEKISLSDEDILTIVDNKANLMAYEDLENYNNIDDVLGQHRAVIILYQSDADFGHWITLFQHPTKPNVLIFFDSYSFKMDQELKFSKFNLRRHQGQVVPHLSHLIEQSNYKVESSDYKFQSNRSHINTCGRWCAVRLLFRNMGVKKFQNFILNSFDMTTDDTVSFLTVAFSLQ